MENCNNGRLEYWNNGETEFGLENAERGIKTEILPALRKIHLKLREGQSEKMGCVPIFIK